MVDAVGTAVVAAPGQVAQVLHAAAGAPQEGPGAAGRGAVAHYLAEVVDAVGTAGVAAPGQVAQVRDAVAGGSLRARPTAQGSSQANNANDGELEHATTP